MSSSVTLRKRKDGSIAIVGDLPKDHAFTPRFLGMVGEQGFGSVHITLETEAGTVDYEVVGVNHTDPDDENSPINEFRVNLVDQPKPTRRRKRANG